MNILCRAGVSGLVRMLRSLRSRTSALLPLLVALLAAPPASAGPRSTVTRKAEALMIDEALRGLPAPPTGSEVDAPARVDAAAEVEPEAEEGEEEEEGEETAEIELADDPRPTGRAGAGASKASKAAAKGEKARPKGAPECEFRSALYEHEVAAGDNLGRIAGRYGVRKDDVLRLNPALKKNPNLLRPGQKLKICPEIAPRLRQATEHVVKKGENLSKIAAKYQATPSELIALQPKKVAERLRKSPKSLQPGQKLVVMVSVSVLAELAPKDEVRGSLAASVQLPAGAGYHVKRPHMAYGTAYTIKAIQAAVSRYKQRRPKGPQVHIGDISSKGGGPLRGHRSHQRGVDVDVGLVHKGLVAAETRFVDANSNTLDVGRTWALIKAFADTGEVRSIFLDYGVQKALYEHARKQGVNEQTLDELFQYPRGLGHPHGLIRHWKGHKNHFHVRFRR